MIPAIAPVGRIGIVEDDEHLRGYLEATFNATEGLEVVFSEGSLAQALRRCAETRPDLCLVDIQLPDGSGVELVRRLKASGGAKCLILTVLGDRASVLIALQAGADGYLLKDTPAHQLSAAVLSTLQGDTPISPQAATFLLEMYKASARSPVEGRADSSLTSREVEVLKLFSRGLSYREAAGALAISHHTIRDHVKAIYRKLSVHSRTEAIFEARQLGVISPLD